MKLLHIDSSALGANSVSRGLSAAIVAEWKAHHPGLQVEYRDLDAEPLPHLTGAALAKSDPAQAAEAARVQQQSLSADDGVVGAPMYHLYIPSTTKASID